jgi:hypothetical protein
MVPPRHGEGAGEMKSKQVSVQWVATSDIPAVLVSGDDCDIKRGTIKTQVKWYMYNGEGWLRFTDRTETPDVFWDKVVLN